MNNIRIGEYKMQEGTTQKKHLSVRLTDMERKMLEGIAKEKNYTLGETIRYLIRAYSNKQ